jgi:hypothetical protein
MPTNRASGTQRISMRLTALQTYQSANAIVVPPGALNALTARLSSFANTVQTRMNSSTGTASTLGGTLEAQVDRALSQVLRQPASTNLPALAVHPGETSIASLVGGSGGAQPIMSPYQATMLREARITQADILAMLDTLQPLSPFTDPGDVASLQAVVRAEVNGLLEEFSYTHLLPRRQRVRVFVGGLLGWDYDGYSTEYGVTSPLQMNAPASDVQALVNLLNLGGPLIPTIAIEDQLASQQVVGSDAALFDAQWTAYWANAVANISPSFPPGAGGGGWSPPGGPWSGPWSLWEPFSVVPPPTLPGPGGLGSLTPQALFQIQAGVLTPTAAAGPDSSILGLGLQSPQASWLSPLISGTPPAKPPASYAEKMIQADLLLPVIAQDATRAENSLAAIGYTTGEQETDFAWLWSAVDTDLVSGAGLEPTPPATYQLPLTPIPVWMTVADILDWAQNLAGASSTDQLRQAGALGLNLLCDQADELFWLVLALLDQTATAQIPALADSEVQLEMFALATDLNQLANLAY